MKSYRPLAESVRTLARSRLRSSPSLWKEYKRVRRSRVRRAVNRSGWFIVLFGAILVLTVQRKGAGLALVLLTLYSAATICTRAAQFFAALYYSGDLAFFMHVPASDREFFDYQWKKLLRSSLLVWFLALVALGFAAFDATHAFRLWPAVLAAATLHWMLVLGLIVIVVLFAPLRAVGKVAVPLYLLTFSTFFLPEPWVKLIAQLMVPLPTAWVPVFFERGALGGDSSSLLFLVPTLGCVAFLPVALPRLRREYPRTHIVYPLLARDVEIEDGFPATAVDAETREEGKAHLSAQPVFLPSFDWNKAGWIERLARKQLGGAEQPVADFLCGGEIPYWTASWRLALKIAGAGVLLSFLRPLPAWLPIAAGIVASLFALPLFGGRWPGVQLRSVCGVSVIPAYSVFPISYMQISRVLVKINLIRYLVWTPCFLMYAAILGWRLGDSAMSGLKVGGLALAVLLSTIPVFIVAQHSQGTTDTKTLNLHTLIGIALAIPLGCIYLGIAVTFMIVSQSTGIYVVLAFALGLGMFLCSGLMWFLYKQLYDRGRIDLVRVAGRY